MNTNTEIRYHVFIKRIREKVAGARSLLDQDKKTLD